MDRTTLDACSRELISESQDVGLGQDQFTVVWKEGEDYFQQKCSSQLPSTAIERQAVLDSLPKPNQPIPLHLFRAPWDKSLHEIKPPFPADSFLKSPTIKLPDEYEPSKDNFRPYEDMLVEAKVYEKIFHSSEAQSEADVVGRSNLCHYYGCVREGDFLTAICLRKYNRTLSELMEDKDKPIPNVDRILKGIDAGLKYLHKIELAHNDMKYKNVVLDDEGNGIIIDFDSCLPLGEKIGGRKVGAMITIKDEEEPISQESNDEVAFNLMKMDLEERAS